MEELEDYKNKIKKSSIRIKRIEKIEKKREKVHRIRSGCAICLAFVFLSIPSILSPIYKEEMGVQLFNILHLSIIFGVMMGALVYLLCHETKFDKKLADYKINALFKRLRLEKGRVNLLKKNSEMKEKEKVIRMENY